MIYSNKGIAIEVDEDIEALLKDEAIYIREHGSITIRLRKERIYKQLSSFVFDKVAENNMGYIFKDGNKFNYKRDNIIFCSAKFQAGAMKPFQGGSSPYKGVSYTSKRDTYEVRIGSGSEILRVGNFKNEIAAANAYNYHAREYYKEYAEYMCYNDVPFMPKEEWEKYSAENILKEKRIERKIIQEQTVYHCCRCDRIMEIKSSKPCGECKERISEINKKIHLVKKEERLIADWTDKNHLFISGKGMCDTCNTIKGLEFFKFTGNIPKRCIECDKEIYAKTREKRLEYNRLYHIKTYTGMTDAEKERALLWRNNNKDKLREARRVRKHHDRALNKALHSNLTASQWKSIVKRFDSKCPLSDSTDLHMEHFIPMAWGHGGTYIENIYPLDGVLNNDKNDSNPFEWIKTRKDIDIDRWDSLVSYLAAQNNLSVFEFTSYVYWCEANKRTIEEIISGNGETSLQLYLKSVII